MPIYHHSTNSRHCLKVPCRECGETLDAIYDPDVRDTCDDCGGQAKTGDAESAREAIRREYLAKVREARHQ